MLQIYNSDSKDSMLWCRELSGLDGYLAIHTIDTIDTIHFLSLQSKKVMKNIFEIYAFPHKQDITENANI